MSRGGAVRLAVGPEAVTVIAPGGQVWSAPVADAPRSQFVDGLAEVVAQLLEGVEPGAVHWALMPPVADVRRVQVPPLNTAQTTDVLTRHAARYFPSVGGEQAIGWRSVDRPRGAPAKLMAAAADAALVDTVRSVIEEAGFKPRDPISAVEAWVSAALEEREDASVVLVVTDRQVVMTAVEDGRAADVAVLPDHSPGRVLSRLQGWARRGPLVVLGNELREGLLSMLRADVPEGLEVHMGRPEEAAVLAARFADSDAFPLTTSETRARRRARRRRRAGWLWAAAGMLVLLAGLLEFWGLHRELAIVEAERYELASAVSDALARREAIEQRRITITAMDSLERTAPAWAGLVGDLARHLPDDAYLEVLRGGPDSLAIDGVASDAAGVFAALRTVPGLYEVQPRGPIRRQVVDGVAVERFALAVRVGPVASTISGNAADEESEREGVQ